MRNPERRIFRAGSTTFYWSARFFPKAVRQDVYRLYAFVRTADDYVDVVPAKPADFQKLAGYYARALAAQDLGTATDERLARNMAELVRNYGFDPAWVEAFLAAMRADLKSKTYKTLDDSLAYVHGSAEVIGLMLARIMDLPAAADHAAQLQGRALQWINFIRDIAEDNALGRCYFPQADLRQFGLKDLSEATARTHPAAFAKFMYFQIDRYRHWQAEAKQGYGHIPHRLRIALQTAAHSYDWTASEIAKNPLVVFDRKVKPGAGRRLGHALQALTK